MKVALVANYLLADDAIGHNAAHEARFFLRRGCDVRVLHQALAEPPDDLRDLYVQVHLSDLAGTSGDVPGVQEARAHFLAADLRIFEYGEYYELAEAIAWSRPEGGLCVVDYHGVTPPELWGDRLTAPAQRSGLDKLALFRAADYVITHSAYIKDDLIARVGFPPERVLVMPYAVPGHFRPGPKDEALLRQFGLEGQFVLLYVGRMAANKRIDLLVEALAHVRGEIPNVSLLLVGDHTVPAHAAHVRKARRLAHRLKVEEALVWAGRVPHADLARYYNTCDVYVTSSLHEGFCIPVVEAMACGKPVVASHTTALPETVGDAGLTFAPGDARDLADNVLAILRGEQEERGLPGRALPRPAGLSLCFVTPRYGSTSVGGAETMARRWAEELARRGASCELLTTCSDSLIDWNNRRRPAVFQAGGITVRRFRTDRVSLAEHRRLDPLFFGERVTYQQQRAWMRNSIHSSTLYEYLRRHYPRFDAIIFTPYLFGTTYRGSRIAPHKSLLLPCFHDERVAYAEIIRRAASTVAGLLFNTEAERRLAFDQLGVVNENAAVIGFGIDLDLDKEGDAARFRARHGLSGPFLLYAGRLELLKNLPQLLDYFGRYVRQHGEVLTLVLMGEGPVDMPAELRPHVFEIGFQTGADKHDAYAAALALCQPSLNESFSIVLMESWLNRRPVLVHGDCPVTRQHVERSGGGLHFRAYDEFESALDLLLADPLAGDEMGQRGRRYIEEHYTWDAVISRLLKALEGFRAETLGQRLGRRGIARAREFTLERYNERLEEVMHVIWPTSEMPAPTSDLSDRQDLDGLLRRLDVSKSVAVNYMDASRIGLAKRIFSAVRERLTRHLRVHYLGPLVGKQSAYNQLVYQALCEMRAELQELRARLEALEEGR